MANSDYEARFVALENAVNKISIAITNLASTQQLRQLSLLKQKEVDDLKAKVADLESQLKLLQNTSL
jgi:polyhydroxyalkanoate synthesis regulator phasin